MAMPAGLRRYWATHRRAGGKSKRRSTRTMKSTQSGHKVKTTIPLAVCLGFTPLVAKGVMDFRAGGFAGLANTVSAIVPYNVASKKLDMSNLNWGLWPILAGFAVHKFIGGTLGVNRAIARMGIPLIRL